jgi:type IV pilus assembly protein PilA
MFVSVPTCPVSALTRTLRGTHLCLLGVEGKVDAGFMRLKTLIIFGSLALIVACWIFLNRGMRLGYIDSAIGSMRTLVDAEKKYAEAHPEVGYTCSISALPSDESKIVEQLRNGTKNQYAFQIGGCQVSNPKLPNPEYQLTARPLLKGMPAYCSDQSGIVKYEESGSAQKCLESGIPF